MAGPPGHGAGGPVGLWLLKRGEVAVGPSVVQTQPVLTRGDQLVDPLGQVIADGLVIVQPVEDGDADEQLGPPRRVADRRTSSSVAG